MTIRSTLLLTCGLAVLGPAASQASDNLVVVKPTGHVRIQASSWTDGIDGTVPIAKGRVEIQEGPFIAPVGKYFVLTRFSLFFQDFNLKARSLGEKALPMRQVGVHLQNAIGWWGVEVQPGVPGVYRVDIPHDAILITGDPTFVFGSKVDPSYFTGDDDVVKVPFFRGDERITEPIVGTIDLNAGTITATAVFKRSLPLDGILGSLGFDVDRTLTITMSGAFTQDRDHDGEPDDKDNCPETPNPSQEPILAPMIILPTDITVKTCEAIALPPVHGVDVCHAQGVMAQHDAPPVLAQGSNNVTWTAWTPDRRSTRAMQHVTVVDKTPPVFLDAPRPVTVAQCGPLILAPPAATDDCGASPFVTSDAPASFPQGSRLVTWTAIDAAGNRATTTQVVTVTSCGLKR